jgi:hypothetical protein
MAKLPNNNNALKPSDYAFPDRNSYPLPKKSTAAGARAQNMKSPPLGRKGDTKLDTLRGKRKSPAGNGSRAVS